MMNNKKGVFFGIYLAFFTIFLITTVLILYLHQQENIESSLVSPVPVLQSSDELKAFELFEKKMILEALEEAKKTSSFGTSSFEEVFREIFLNSLLSSEEETSFIFSDIFFGGEPITETASLEKKAFLENILYPREYTYFEGSSLVLKRQNVYKEKTLYGWERHKINFPVIFRMSLEERYLIEETAKGFLISSS